MNGKIYTAKEVGKMTGLTTKTVTQYIRDGKLEANKFGTSYVITEEALNKYLEYRGKRGHENKL